MLCDTRRSYRWSHAFYTTKNWQKLPEFCTVALSCLNDRASETLYCRWTTLKTEWQRANPECNSQCVQFGTQHFCLKNEIRNTQREYVKFTRNAHVKTHFHISYNHGDQYLGCVKTRWLQGSLRPYKDAVDDRHTCAENSSQYIIRKSCKNACIRHENECAPIAAQYAQSFFRSQPKIAGDFLEGENKTTDPLCFRILGRMIWFHASKQFFLHFFQHTSRDYIHIDLNSRRRQHCRWNPNSFPTHLTCVESRLILLSTHAMISMHVTWS